MSKFKIGDVVTLTCGGIKFTITHYNNDTETFACHGENGEMRCYDEDELVKVTYVTPTVITDDNKRAYFLCNWMEHELDKFHSSMEWYTGKPIWDEDNNEPPSVDYIKRIWVGIYVFRKYIDKKVQ